MKTLPISRALLAFTVSVLLAFQAAHGQPSTASAAKAGQTFSSLDFSPANEEVLPAGTVALADADLTAAFALYEKLSRRSVIPGDHLPSAKLSYRIEAALPRRELLQALDTLLSQYGVTMIVMGTNFMKAVLEHKAISEAAPEVSLSVDRLPDSNTYVHYVVRLQNRPVNDAVPVLQPLCHLPNSILTMPSSNSILLRDYSANVRRMVNVIQRFDVPDDGRVFDEPVRRPARPKN